MPKFLEAKLKAEAASKGLTGRRAAAYTYGTLNDLGAMRGNQETDTGRAMDAKHQRDLHPTMQRRGQMVKEAHAHLGSAIPGFSTLPSRQKMMAVQHHVNLRLGTVK